MANFVLPIAAPRNALQDISDSASREYGLALASAPLVFVHKLSVGKSASRDTGAPKARLSRTAEAGHDSQQQQAPAVFPQRCRRKQGKTALVILSVLWWCRLCRAGVQCVAALGHAPSPQEKTLESIYEQWQPVNFELKPWKDAILVVAVAV